MTTLAASREKFAKWLANESIKRRKHEAKNAYTRKRSAFLRSHPICAVCEKPGTDTVHHQRGRKGDALLDDTHFIAVHSACDRWIHRNPKEARQRGLLLV